MISVKKYKGLQKFHVSKEFCIVACVLFCAIGLRFILILFNWPYTDAEEGTFALEAMHIAFKGAWPVFMYGQNYMGVAESYLGAVMYHLFGVSIFSLRLGMLLMFSVFLVLVYFLGRMLYGRVTAIISLVALIGATDVSIISQLKAVGGVEEVFVSGTLALLLAGWLVLSATRSVPPPRWKRWLAYTGWGIATGFGLWSHLLVVPFIFCSALLLLIFCRREFLTFCGLFLLLGLLIGGWPLIAYNLTAPWSESTPMVFLRLYIYHPKVPSGLDFQLQKLVATFGYTLPLETGMLHIDTSDAVSLNQVSLPALLAQFAWSLGYLALMAISLVSASKSICQQFAYRRLRGHFDPASRYQVTLDTARILLIMSAVITIAAFAASSNSALRPGSFRYLSGLTITNVVVLAPLVTFFTHYYARYKIRIVKYAVVGITVSLIAINVTGTVQNVVKLPDGNQRLANQSALVAELEKLGIKDFYSGYWICDRIIFQSQEKLTCARITNSLHLAPTRYVPYAYAVSHDKDAAYVFTVSNYFHPDTSINLLMHDHAYQHTVIDNFLIFFRKKTTDGIHQV